MFASPLHRGLLARLGLAGLLSLAAMAAGAQSSPWYVGAALGLTHDSNVYRLPDSLPASQSGLAGLVRADRITTATLLAGLDQPFGRQHAYGSLSLRDSRFAHNKALDNDGYALKLGLDWSTIERLSGQLNLQANRDLAFANPDNGVPTLLARNIARSLQWDGSLRYGLVSRWQAESTFGHRTLDYSAPAYQSRAYRENWLSIGLRFRPSGALGLGLALRENRGSFPQYSTLDAGGFAADDYKRQDIDLTADWIATGASSFNARLSTGRLRHSQAAQRNYSGATGELRWQWRPTGKLLVTSTLAREAGQEFGAGGSFFVTASDLSRSVNALRTQVDWSASAKVSLVLGASSSQRALVDTQSTIFGQDLVLDGRDRSTSLWLGARWRPLRSTVLSCDFSQERRSSDGRLSSAFSARVFGCAAQMTLQ